jgi:uncharacterized protein YfaS (alpha-2-macroglobulin family)
VRTKPESNWKRRGLVLFAAVGSLLSGPGAWPAQAAAETPIQVRRPAGETGTVIVPNHFLRRWDPVTIFFARDVGPAQGGPEDHPERVVTMSPAQPGAFTWLDARTLQFKPAEPWPSLQRVTWHITGTGGPETSVTLATLMAAPVQTNPRDGAEGLGSFDEMTLTFPEPLDPIALGRMVSIELRPLPGVGGARARWLTKDDFKVKAIERRSRAEPASYALVLSTPVPLGTRAVVHMRLSLDDSDQVSFKELSFSTAEPFRVTGFGCRDRQLPVTPEGTRYTRDQAVRCGSDTRSLVVEFSATPAALGPVVARNLVRFTPAVEGLSFDLRSRTLEITGRFAWDTLYGVTLVPTPISDAQGRSLDLQGASELFLYFPRKASFVRWGASQGIVERLGPQMVPLEGRGEERVDLRIFRVGALDRSFWPFPDRPISVDEAKRPPGPGEEPKPFADPQRNISTAELIQQIENLGSPLVSALETLPLKRDASSATFGLDLQNHLARIAGKGEPGAYLVGIRQLESPGQRSWMRVQATDLALTTVEEPRAVRFEVTSLSTGQPVAGARVRVEGTESGPSATHWVTFVEGTTDTAGSYRWIAPGFTPNVRRGIRRLVVEKQGPAGQPPDTLVVDPARPPERYADNQWSSPREPWLDWVFGVLDQRGPQPETLCHIFTERPVYRPEELVHIKGYVRERNKGVLSPARFPEGEIAVVVEGPGDLIWRFPVALTPAGSFYHAFSEKNLPTGEYRAHLQDAKKVRYGNVAFRMEAYRIPEFEVELHAPEHVPLDKEFEVSLTATYYAGGKVGGQRVQWRVTQFPYDWTPRPRPGFRYSSDGRFSRTERFQSSPRLEKDDVTSDAGSAMIVLNPAIEPTAQPRTYVVEATVTGADDQTVTATRRIAALPPFVLGLKAPRYIERATEIAPQVIAVGPDGDLLAGKEITVKLLRRQWHSVLRASDFSDGVARYLTDIVDEKVSELKVKSGAAPLTLRFPIEKAGVYVVELEARDRLDRAQVVAVDLYAGGHEPMTWAKPVTRVFSVATDQPRYDPGSTAAIVLKSPFQRARALAIIEAPDGNQYDWLDVEGGAATFRLPIKSTYIPKVAVHFALMRGRLAGIAPTAGNSTDLGKPTTMAATAWLEVNPVTNRVDVQIENPASARPGQKVDVKVSLKEPHGKPLPGEVTLWLVDQAVLALGKERPLDPLPDFITRVSSHMMLRDTRNSVFGFLPFAENPGGDQGEKGGILDRVTVRKTFKTVPYYNPSILIGAGGTTTVSVELPDNLTNFKLRAKAVSGQDRFGFGTGQLAVRLPVIVKPALPRFVRPGDRFTASAIGRIVEGPGGPGSAQLKADGLKLIGSDRRELAWAPGRPERIDILAEVPTPPYAEDGTLSYDTITFRVGVERASDRASDAFEVKLPIRDDRERVTRRTIESLKPGVPVSLPAVPEKPRPGTLRRSVIVSDQPGLVKMAAGLDFLVKYPYGCTEQQVSRARAHVALQKFRALLHQKGAEHDAERAVRSALEWVASAVDRDGLVSYWPGSRGYVSLTAWVVQFLTEARQAGFAVDSKLLTRLTLSLEQALRSDYSHFIDGEAFAERAWALTALAEAGSFNAAYAAELSRKAAYLKLEGVAGVVQSFAYAKQARSETVKALSQQLWDGLVIRLYQGRETYGGLQQDRWGGSGLILPTETRTLAEVTRALARADSEAPRLQLLVDALVTLGRGDGWGTTNANASALLALSEILQPPFRGSTPHTVTVRQGGMQRTVQIGPDTPVGQLATSGGAPEDAMEIVLQGPPSTSPVVLRAETSWIPAADGSTVPSESTGFVVTRELLRIGATDVPPERHPLMEPGTTLKLGIGDVVEEHIQVVNPKERHHVAVVTPLAAGFEPLNPSLLTAPPEANPSGKVTSEPTYVQFLDDQVGFYYDTLPAGTYNFYFRTRATTLGSFVQPPARAEMLYDGAVHGNSAGARVEITRTEK